LPAIVGALRKSRPEIRFNVEMATRDPLLVPCLTEKYWASLGQLPASVLARMLSLVRDRKEARPLRRVSGLPAANRLAEEDENVRTCLRYAHAELKG
ncbi:MAG: sugar phosphate isomerase/epimerase, partial [Actinomycetota bacterium]